MRLVFFGDSICVGQGVSIHKGWVTRLAARLGELSERTGVNIVVDNASINGNTTRQALERMAYDVQSHGVDFLIVQFGMNDCNHWMSDNGLPRVSEKAFAANLEEIIVRGIRFGAKKVMLNTNHPTTRDIEKMCGSDLTYEQSNRRYNQIIREVGEKMGDAVRLNDVAQRFLLETGDDPDKLRELLLGDGLHLSSKGHDLYFDLICPVLETELGGLLVGAQRSPREANQFLP